MIRWQIPLGLTFLLVCNAVAQPPRRGGGPPDGPPPARPVPIQDGALKLNAENSMIQFVGTHVGENPDPRVGFFRQFEGSAKLSDDRKAVTSVEVTIQTASLETPIPNLTDHLRSPDFFSVQQHPTAKFVTTSIKPQGAPGNYQVVGKLTMLGNTQEVSFPAKFEIGDDGVTMDAKLTLDRTQFGMDQLQDRVEKNVELTLAVGRPAPMGGPGGGRGFGPGGRGPGGPFDPAAFFKERDTDGDGKLSGDELSERMRENLSAFDKDGDGAISQAEFEERIREFGGRRGGGGGERNRPRPRPARPT